MIDKGINKKKKKKKSEWLFGLSCKFQALLQFNSNPKYFANTFKLLFPVLSYINLPKPFF